MTWENLILFCGPPCMFHQYINNHREVIIFSMQLFLCISLSNAFNTSKGVCISLIILLFDINIIIYYYMIISEQMQQIIRFPLQGKIPLNISKTLSVRIYKSNFGDISSIFEMCKSFYKMNMEE